MPKLSGTTLLARAIPEAIADREELIVAYGGKGEEADEIRQEIERIRALAGHRFETLDEAERKTAFAAFVFAEQNLESLAAANHMRGKVARDCMDAMLLLRKFRHANMGRSRMEADITRCVAVDIREVGRAATVFDSALKG